MHPNVRADASGLYVLRAAVLAVRGPAPETAPGVGPALPASTDASVPAHGSRSPVREPDTAESQRIRALVELAQSGDAEAFAQLYDRYVGTVYRYVYYRVGSRPMAEDLTSEAFLRALRRIDTFSWRGRDFGAWLVTIARNLVADEFKSSRFRLEVATGEILDGDEVADSPENAVLAALSSAALVDAIRQLKPHQQECVALRFLQGMSVAETADIMGKNEGAIKTLQYRAVRSLARLLPGRP